MIRPSFLRRRSKLPATLTALAVIVGVLSVPQAALALNGSALQFDGATQHVKLTAGAALGATNFTVETWFVRSGAGIGTSTGTGGFSNTSAIPLVTKGRSQADANNQDANYFLGIHATSGRLIADFEEGATGPTPGLNHPLTGGTTVTQNVWHHAAVTYDGLSMKLYLDGVLDGTLVVSTTTPVPPRNDSAQWAALGTAMNTTGAPAGFFAGTMDESRIWNVARTQAQVQSTKDSQISAPTAGLIGRWGYNEGSGSSVADGSGSGVTGTVVGNPNWVPGFGSVATGPPAAPNLVTPTDGANGTATDATLTVGVSDPQGTPMTVTFRGRPFNSGLYQVLGTNTDVASGTNTSFAWDGLDPGQRYEWQVSVSDGESTVSSSTWVFNTAPGTDPVLVGAGDIAGCGTPLADAQATANILKGVQGIVMALGDNAYPDGALNRFTDCYDPTWGAEKARTMPVAGNKEWEAGPLTGYIGYFGAAVATPAPTNKSYYSYNLGPNWHVVVLDSECLSVAGGCGVGSAQMNWFQADLIAARPRNTIVQFHKPYVGSGNQDTPAMRPAWDIAYAEGVDIILNGHSHIYERMAPMTPTETADSTFGVRNFTVGSGGESHGVINAIAPRSVVLDNTTFGVLKLQLHASSYEWDFMPVAGGTLTDSGSSTVHGRPGNVNPNATPQSVSTSHGAAKTITLAGTDANSDPLTFAIGNLPTHGQLYDGPTVSGSPLTAGSPVTDVSGRVTYVSTAGYLGADSFTFTASDGTPSAPATVSINVTNAAPAFSQNLPNRTDAEGAVISLSSGATDVDNDTLTYAATDLPTGLSISTSTGLITGTIANTANAGSPFSTSITVSEDGGATVAATDTFTWTVNNTNQLPSFNQDLTGRADSEGETITQPAPATDPDNDTLTYGATGLPPGMSINTATGEISGTLSFNAAANSPYSVAVTVSDNGGTTIAATDSFSWSVTNTNRPPTLNQNFTSFTNAEGGSVSIPAGGTDPDGDTLYFAATGLPPGLTVNSTTGTISGTVGHDAADGSPYSPTFKVSDDGGLTFGATDSFTWNISVTNILPQFDQNLQDRTSAETRRVSLSASASDLDGDPLTYTATGLPTGLSIDSSTGLISGRIDDNAAANSPFTVQLRVSDNGGTTTGDIDNFTWTVTSNDDPTFDTVLVDRNDPEGTVVSMSASATDPNNDTLLYGATGLPAGISIDTETGLISGTISYLASPDSPYAVTVTVSDDNGNTENATQSFTWIVTNANQAPVFDFDIVDRTDDQNDVISMQLSATDVDGETLTYGAFGLPPGLHVNSTEGVVFGTIAANAATGSPYTVELWVSDDGGATIGSSDYVEWTVRPNFLPEFDSPLGNQVGDEGEVVSLPAPASDINDDPLTYSATGLPPGLSINPTTGTITGTIGFTANANSPYSVSLQVSDDGGTTIGDTDPLSWSVTNTNRPPTFNQNLVTRTDAEQAVITMAAPATDPDGDTLTYDATDLPPGLSINPSTGTVTGTIGLTAAAGSPYAVVLKVSDNGGVSYAAIDPMSWTVTNTNQLPTFDQNLGNRTDAEGDVISLSAGASDFDNDSLKYAATNLPPGITINQSSGLISGTIGYTAAATSPFNVGVTVSDDNGVTTGATDTFTWTVTNTNRPPTFNQNLADRTNDENTPISLSAAATDIDNDTLTYAATGLPGGLSINSSTGLITGTIGNNAVTNSPYSVSITVSENGGVTVAETDTFTWTVLETADILFRSSSTGANATASNLTITKPATVSFGNVMVAVIDVRSNPTATAPAGWTQVSMTPNGTTFRQYVFTKVATGSEPASYQFTFNQSRPASGAILAYSGVNTTNPVETFTAGTASSANITAPSATSTFNGAMVVGAFGINNSSAVAPPAGMTERGEIASGSRIKTEVADYVLNPAGATGAKTATAASATANIGQLIVLRPGGPAGPNLDPSFAQNLPDRSDPATSPITLSAGATDPEGDTLSYAATGLPTGLSINATTGQITGTIAAGATANSPYATSITVSDDNFATVGATDTFTWTVTAAPPAPPIAFRSVASAANNTTTSLIIPRPAGVLTGDVMVAVVDVRQNPTATPPAGWSEVSMTPNGTTYRQFVFTKVATGAEPTSYTFGFNQSRRASGAIAAYSGVSTTNPVESVTAATASSASITAPSATTVATQAMVVGAFSINNSSAIAPPAGMTERAEIASGSSIKTEVADYVQTSPGATGAKTATAATATANIGQLIVLRPAGPAVNQDPTFDQNLANRTNNEGAVISLSAHATDPESDTLTYAATGLPTGLSINTSTGLITGTISAGASTNSPFSTSITVSDDDFATVGATDTFTWTVTVAGPNQDPTFDQNLPNRSDAQGAVISLSAHATDPELDTLTYAATGLPTGLSINTSTGLISGTISGTAAAGSPYSTSITVSDDNFATVGATDTFTWTVTAGGGGITFRSASSGANNVGNNVVIPAPAGVQNNDVMVAVLDIKVAPTTTPPAGWNLVNSTANGSNFTQKVYTKVATGSEPADYTFTINENRAISGVIVAYSGVNTSNPVEIAGTVGSGTTTSITAPSVTSGLSGGMLIGAFGINADSTIAPPAGMTERGEIVSATRIRTEVSDLLLGAAGATGAKTATAATAAASLGQLIVLRPA